jgi:hypothetical protein
MIEFSENMQKAIDVFSTDCDSVSELVTTDFKLIRTYLFYDAYVYVITVNCQIIGCVPVDRFRELVDKLLKESIDLFNK